MRALIAPLIVLLWTVGCGPQPSTSDKPTSVEAVDAVELQAFPTALNFDDTPGPDGLRAQVYLFLVDRPQPVLASGKLELLMFDGNVTSETVATAKPLHVWAFSGPALSSQARKLMAGWGYYFNELLWDKDSPKKGSVTLVARYLFAGKTIYSSPVGVASRAS